MTHPFTIPLEAGDGVSQASHWAVPSRCHDLPTPRPGCPQTGTLHLTRARCLLQLGACHCFSLSACSLEGVGWVSKGQLDLSEF